MATIRNILSLVVLVAVLAACKSLAPVTRTYSVDITSNPSGAMVLRDGQQIGTTPCTVQLPVTVTPHVTGKGFNSTFNTTVSNWELDFVKDGYTEHLTMDPTKCNFINGRNVIDYTFRALPYMNDPTIPMGEAGKMVSRDNPGGTALEGTVIRWFFDSEPRGARIYWRVVSSVPQEVKNTNETYLMTTPYEETRGFNILGLTYENSRDVTIEVKVSKQGYEDQVKRFNVRQAIDQQEISGFFELVPKAGNYQPQYQQPQQPYYGQPQYQPQGQYYY